jgi:hypothetical protein
VPARILGNRSTTSSTFDTAQTVSVVTSTTRTLVGAGDGLEVATAPLIAGLTPEPEPVAVGPKAEPVAPGELPYQSLAIRLHGKDFIPKVRDISERQGFKPEWLMAVMFNESGLKASARNRLSGATGLIQFMPRTAQWLGTSVDALGQMSGVQQLNWVQKYFSTFEKGSLKSGADLSLANFYPLAVGKEPEFVLGSEISDKRARLVRNHNRPMDVDRDGYISVRDFRDYYAGRFPNLA